MSEEVSMGILTAALTMLLQEPGGGDLRFEDVKIIAERNIFSPVKPKDVPKKKEEVRKEEKKAESPLLPVVTGFEGYPDGFRILILDRAKNASSRFKVGDALVGGVVESIDTTRAVVKTSTGDVIELRNGDTISNGIGLPPPPNASAVGRMGAALAFVMKEKSEGEGAGRGKKKRRVEEEEEEETPRKKRRGNRP